METIQWMETSEFRKQVKFGDTVCNHWASDGNPNKYCRFVRFTYFRGRMNGGEHAELISDDGDKVFLPLKTGRFSICKNTMVVIR